MTKPSYPWSDEQLLDWAGEHVRKPWERFCRIADALSRGQELSLAESRVKIPLTPFTADYRALYHLVRDIGGLVTWDPGNLFTIITDSQGKRIIRAYLERTRDNNYVELIPVDPQTPWLLEAMEMIAANNLSDLRRHVDEHARRDLGVWVNWVKIANIHFFGIFRKILEAWEAGEEKTLTSYLDGVLGALQVIYQKGWIRFEPAPPAFSALEEWITRILEIEPGFIDWKLLLGQNGKKKKSIKNDARYLLAIRGRDYTTALQYDPNDPYHITCDSGDTRAVANVPLKKLPAALARQTGAKMVLALRSESLANLIYETLYRRFPQDREDTKIILRRALEIIRRFQEQWSMYPLPFYLKRRYRLLGRLFSSPFDISRLAVRDIVQTIIEGEMIVMGIAHHRVFCVLRKDKPALLVSVLMSDGALRRIKIWNPEDFEDLFQDLKLKDSEDLQKRAIAVSHRIWEKDEWVNFTLMAQADFLGRLAKLLAPKRWKSPWRLWRIFFQRVMIRRQARKGGLAFYPDRLILDFMAWIKRRGRMGVLFTVTKTAFNLGPQTRGILFWKGTLLWLGILGLAAAAVVYLLFNPV